MGRKINFFRGKKPVDNLRVSDKFPPTMKFETLNAILTCLLGVLVVLGVVLALNVAFVTHDSRTLQQMAVAAKVNIARAQGLFAAAQTYNQTYHSAELTRILESAQPAKPANR